MYYYYSTPADGSDEKYLLDFTEIAWSDTNGGDGHILYRNIFPGAIIHCGIWYPEDKHELTDIKYHLGER